MHEEPLGQEYFQVRSFDVDPFGNLRPRVLLGYLQETAGQHAAQLGAAMERLQEDNLAWVLHRIKLEFKRLPRLHESITIHTWPTDFSAVQAQRDFIIYGAKQEVLGGATSAWVVIQSEKRRITRLPKWIRILPINKKERPLDGNFESLTPLSRVDFSTDFSIRWEDLDLLGHVNNARYASFVLETVPESKRSDRNLQALELVYKQECGWGDRIIAEAQTIEAGFYCHQLRHAKSNKILLQAQSRFV